MNQFKYQPSMQTQLSITTEGKKFERFRMVVQFLSFAIGLQPRYWKQFISINQGMNIPNKL